MNIHLFRTTIAGALILLAACRLHAQVVWYTYIPNPLYDKIEPSVLYDSSAGYYAMWYLVPGSGIMKAVSADGSNWFFGDTPVLAPGGIEAFDHLIHSVNVTKNGSVYLMYYTASRSGDALSIGLATSQDGKDWQKNPLSPVLTHGSLQSWDSRSVAGPKVIVANGTFKMWYGGTDGTYTNTGLATSLDGVSWSKNINNPVLPHGQAGEADEAEAGVMGVTNRNGLYYMIYRSINKSGVQTFSLATSQDGTNWIKYHHNPVKRASGWDAYGLGGGTLLWRNGLFHLWYSGNGGGYWGLGQVVSEPTPLSVDGRTENPAPAAFALQNYPNPFNPATTIRFQVPDDQNGSGVSGPGSGWVRLSVYDMLGREVAVLVNERMEKGVHDVNFDGSALASGVYLCRLQAGDFAGTTRLVLMK